MIPSNLLCDVKAYLDVTWSETDGKIMDMIQSGIAYLNSKLGRPADYTASGFARTLLFEYVRYMRDSALDVFEVNYRHMILAMQNEVLNEAVQTEA